jgi:hypothetical protein
MDHASIDLGYYNLRLQLTKCQHFSQNQKMDLGSGKYAIISLNKNDLIISATNHFTPDEIMSVIQKCTGIIGSQLLLKSFDFVLKAQLNDNSADYLEYFIPGSGISFEKLDDNRIEAFSRYGNQIASIKSESDKITIIQHYNDKCNDRLSVEDLCSHCGFSRCVQNMYRLMDRLLLKSSANNNIQNIRTKTDLQRMLIARFLQSRSLRESMLLEIEQKYRDGEITDGSIVRLREMLRSVPNEDPKLSELHSIKAAILSKVLSTKLAKEFESLDATPCPIPSNSGIEAQQPNRIIHFA